MKPFLYISFLALIACKGNKQVLVENIPQEENRPGWLLERPISSMDYIGIGMGNVAQADYQETAKKNALNDLASEISVNIEGNSLLYTLDRRYTFEEEFSSSIRSSTSEQLEGYELYDSWSGAGEYWVYYRLDKAEHARLKAARKQRAMDKAKDLHSLADRNLDAGNIRDAFNNELKALLAMKDYWNEEDRTTLDGQEVFLSNVIHARLQELTSNIRFSVLPKTAVLELKNDFKSTMRLEAEYDDENRSVGLAQMPVVIELPRNGRIYKERVSTGVDGELMFTVQDVDMDEKQDVCITVDLENLIGPDMKDRVIRPLLNTLTRVSLRVPIEVEYPVVRLVSREKNLGHDISQTGVTGLSGVLKQELTEKGFTFTNGGDADLLVDLKASTRKGGEMSGFYTVYLDLDIVFENAADGKIIHHTSEQQIKGVQLNWKKAGSEAYRKGGEALRERIVPEMLKSLM